MSSSSDPIRTDTGLEWTVQRTGQPGTLPPVTVIAKGGAIWLHDWLTVSAARDLGARLMALALEVESAEAETEHFDRLDSEESAAEREMGLLCDVSLAQAKAAGELIDAVVGERAV
jgi:hypothetical protein